MATRIEVERLGALLAHRSSAADAESRIADEINAEIQRRPAEQPALAVSYKQHVADQREIDQLRAKGQPVPLELIANPFHRRYYVEMGWSDPPQRDAQSTTRAAV